MSETKNRNYRVDPERGIVVPNYCAAQLPKITVEIKSGRTTYRFTSLIWMTKANSVRRHLLITAR